MGIIVTKTVTVPFLAKDMITGAVRDMRWMIQGAHDDLINFRRASGSMFDGFVSDSRRARESADDLGRRIGGASDEVRRMNQIHLDDIFRRARAGADDLRRSADRADSEIRSIRDAHVKLRAEDSISPVVDQVSDKISALAALAGGIMLGSGVGDSMFGGVADYSREAARSAAYMPENIRQQGLNMVDELVKKNIISDRAEGARQLADAAPLVQDKSKLPEFIQKSSEMQYILPGANPEETNRALSQGANSFKESYTQIADSIMYSYKEVGDKQQDVLDTFWEYSPYFARSGTSSQQMSNYLTKSVKEGAFNFDKPADFFKETFGVKALNTGDMAKYFETRGSGKDEAQRQAEAFTRDINSGNKQQAQGAIMALIADLRSQTRDKLKDSLVTLGSAAAEDNADSILKTYGVPFEKAPDMRGTTDNLVRRQQAADPMTEMNQTRAEISMEMQKVGANITTAALPAFKEFNTLLVENKDNIEALGTGVTTAVKAGVGFYKDHITAINTALMGMAAVLILKGIVSFSKGIKQLNSDLAGAERWMRQKVKGATSSTAGGVRSGWDWIRNRGKSPADPEPPTKRKFTLQRNTPQPTGAGIGGLRPASSMNINAGRVYVNGPVSGDGGGSDLDLGDRRKRSKRRGRTRGGRKSIPLRFSGEELADLSKKPISARLKPKLPIPDVVPNVPRGGRWGKVLSGGGKLLKAGSKVVKGAGIIGTVASVGMGVYDLYQASKEKGAREAASTKGGAIVSGVAGGVIGGAVGSVLGPLGTAAGAYIGNLVGEKIGKFADESGATRWVVDKAVGVFDSVKDTWGGVKDWFTGKKEEKPGPPPEAKITINGLTKQKQQRLQQIGDDVHKSIVDKGLKAGLQTVADQPEVKQRLDALKNAWGVVWKMGDSSKAQKSIKDVAKNKQSFESISATAKTAVDKTRQYLLSLKNVSSQGNSWGSDLMSRFIAGMRGQFPTLSSVVSSVAVVLKKMKDAKDANSGGGGITPKPKPKPYAQGGYINRPHVGLVGEAGPEMIIPLSANRRSRGRELWERAGIIMGVRPYANGGQVGRPSMIGATSMMPMAQMLSQPVASSPKSVVIKNINLDLGELAKGITNFAEFARMLTSPQGRALIRSVVGEELIKALENGG